MFYFVAESIQTMTQKLLIIGLVWPEPNSSAAGTRMLQLIDLFRKQEFEIVFASAAANFEFSFDVAAIGVEKVNIELNDPGFDVFVKGLNPNIVLFDRFVTEEQFGWRVAENCPNALRILDTEDLHCLRLARQNAFKSRTAFGKEQLFSDVAKREIASILRCDVSLIISKVEMEILQDDFKIDQKLLYYLPFLEEAIDETVVNSWPAFEDRSDFVFIGNFLHEPNWNAVQFLKESIWSVLKKQLPEVSLKIYGAYPSQKVLQLHNPEQGFLIMGRAENAAEVIKKARVVLAPIRFGAGAKGKLIEAMQCGTPNVTTAVGAESMHDDLPWGGIIADGISEIAAAAIQLYQEKLLWEQSQKNGIQIINQKYAKPLFETDFIRHIFGFQKNLEQHRLDNFLGSILMHHSLMSTKYMSKWIEEKNKHN